MPIPSMMRHDPEDCNHMRFIKEHKSYGGNIPDNCQGAVFPGDEAHVECDISGDYCCNEPNDPKDCFRWEESTDFYQIGDIQVYYSAEDNEYLYDDDNHDEESIVDVFVECFTEQCESIKDKISAKQLTHVKDYMVKLLLEKT